MALGERVGPDSADGCFKEGTGVVVLASGVSRHFFYKMHNDFKTEKAII